MITHGGRSFKQQARPAVITAAAVACTVTVLAVRSSPRELTELSQLLRRSAVVALFAGTFIIVFILRVLGMRSSQEVAHDREIAIAAETGEKRAARVASEAREARERRIRVAVFVGLTAVAITAAIAYQPL